jgi:hypothetical protein
VAVFRQVVVCPCCGASRRPSDLNLNPDGSVLEEERKEYQLLVKTQELLGNRNIKWTSYPMPKEVMAGVAVQLREALAQVEAVLATEDA